MRRMLESSWNIEAMGEVPRDASSAAQAVVTALRQALQDDNENYLKPGVYFVDLQFPPYDISQGENMYDEVAAVEFCMEIAQRLQSSSSAEAASTSSVDNPTSTTRPCNVILVKDDKTLQTVNRVLRAREQSQAELQLEDEEEEEEEDEDDKGEDEDDDDDEEEMTDSKENSIQYYDDFSDFASASEVTAPPSSSTSSDDVDAFRQKLVSNWDADAAESSSSLEASSKKPSPKSRRTRSKKRNTTSPSTLKPTSTAFQAEGRPASSSSSYRLASLFGASTIAQGADMGGDVIRAVQEHVQPWENSKEEFVMVLSAMQPEEFIAIRYILQLASRAALDDDGGGDDEEEDSQQRRRKRSVILVNCKLEDPLPRELSHAKTVYSVMPLVARLSTSDTNLFQNNSDDNKASTERAPPLKVVVLRQYPRDWEVFVDDGLTGSFELAATTKPPVRAAGSRGPPMQWVSTCIKNFLQSRLR